MSQDPASDAKPSIRWWPAILIAAVTVGFLIYMRLGEAMDHQQLALKSIMVAVVGSFLLWLWLLLASRLPGKTRLKLFGASLAAVALFAGMFKIKGVSGDLVPILEFRWAGGDAYEEVRGQAEATVSPFDFPQFRGQNRDGVVRGVTLARDWEAQPPKELWRRPVGEAWSGFAVVGDAALTLEQIDGKEVLSRYDLKTGEPVWTQGIEANFESVIGGNGPRSTPTVHNGRVFTFGAQADVRAVDLATGELIWHRSLQQDFTVKVPDWGYTSSPLIVPGETPESDMVIVSLGNQDEESTEDDGHSLVALSASSGEDVWAVGDAKVGYSSPDLRTLAGTPQILLFNGASVDAYAPADGAHLWSVEWPGDHPHVAQPMVMPGDRLLVSSGYGYGAKLFQISLHTDPASSPSDSTSDETSTEGSDEANEANEVAEETTEADASGTEPEADLAETVPRVGPADGTWIVEEIWESRRLKAKFAGFVEHNGKIYGLDDGIMACMDPETGDKCWKRGRYGHGQLLLVGDLLLVQTEKGEVKLLEANPEELKELGSFEALSGKSWNTLTLSNNYLILRNADEAVCYELPLAG